MNLILFHVERLGSCELTSKGVCSVASLKSSLLGERRCATLGKLAERGLLKSGELLIRIYLALKFCLMVFCYLD